MHSISDIFKQLRDAMTSDDISLDEILEVFHERGFGVFLFFFSLPAALPLPAVGVGTVLGLPLLFLTAQQAMGRHTIWFPKKMRAKRLKCNTIRGFADKAEPWVACIERFIKPRLGFVTQGAFSNLIGVFGFLMTLAVCIPLPLTNTVPSLGIALMAIGILMRDGLAVLAGAGIGILWICMLSLIVIVLGVEGIDLIKDMIKSYL
ncbi:MAG: exopolysaccharide biosynthesis protein [Alphaproteobacteria bacterium]